MYSKNFFAIFSSPKSPQSFSRESEMLSTIQFSSKFVHLINSKKDFQNRGRLELAPDLPSNTPTLKER